MPPFHLESITAGADCAVLRVAGEVDVYTAPQLRERVIGLLAGGVRHIVADLREVDFLDSTGLGALVGSLRRNVAATKWRRVDSRPVVVGAARSDQSMLLCKRQ